MATLFPFLIAFISVFTLVFLLRPVAQNMGLVDKPCNRKQHVGEVPLIGGLAIYVAITICSFVVTPFDANYKIYMLSTSFIVLIGALDDYHDLDARLRLIAQFLIGALMVFGAGLYIEDLGNIAGGGIISLGLVGPIFTVLAVVACINAFNMTDGVDGLVGAMSLNTFISLGILSLLSGVSLSIDITAMLTGAVAAFLFFNFGYFKKGKYKIFMGDAGSMLMGLTVIWLLTYSTQGESAFINPITAVWLIAIPLMDMFSVMFRRTLAGNSPLKADRDHLHHLLLAKGYSSKQTTLLITLLNSVFCLIGISSELLSFSQTYMAIVFVICFVIYNQALTHCFKYK
ncbi:UDP-N-acetylglucosamine--undecaprenyl-phosphate N-acetylglucosaminephosphotransferase [Alteromonas facilis]|uniref:UDP-N-acetylglucosamine--undecaprenyl-phosphate N-acetylglucosaminephosphotransferase n=1 Tax=Alteromonas facilis TaxID=2048004 RepID=UPI0013DC644F|nr:UDP-N-acetylglucosamine--undecaprenyl-phosphate N-acetylglucosaminephosphotransferase [Alteromonas facilis]